MTTLGTSASSRRGRQDSCVGVGPCADDCGRTLPRPCASTCCVHLRLDCLVCRCARKFASVRVCLTKHVPRVRSGTEARLSFSAALCSPDWLKCAGIRNLKARHIPDMREGVKACPWVTK
eukprot:6175104-Pleurochrysis_carterae.AAC.1